MSEDYLALLPFCETAVQTRNIQALIDHPSQVKAAKAIGMDIRGLQRSLKAIRLRAARQGYSPDHDYTKPVPPGFHLRGESILYDEAGNVKLAWVKSQIDHEAQAELLREAITSAFEDYKATSHKITSPRSASKSILPVIPMGDPHIGMYAWADETGENFDVDIAERELCASVDNLVDRSPPAHTAIILNLGDYFHADNMRNATMRNNNPLDVDSRWQRVLRIGVRAMIQCVYSALKKHKRVVLRNMTGNHDDHSSHFLSIAMSLYFENNKRVIVDDSPMRFWYYRFGKVLLGSTHGDTAKPSALPGIMAADRAEDWGDTAFRYWLTGHIHSTNKQEFPGVVWESFRTLAAKDAWHTEQGYRSGRDMQSIVYHRDHGEVERHIMNISMLRTA